MYTKFWLTCSLSVSMIIVGYGGGGGGTSTTQPVITPPAIVPVTPETPTPVVETPENPVTISGTVINGNIEGAKVCLDANTNFDCEADEPSGTTDQAGKYQLTFKYNTFRNSNIVALVTGDTKNSVEAGKTLKEAGKKPYILATPVAAFKDAASEFVVSPLTTMVVAQYTLARNQFTLDQAAEAVTATINQSRQLGTSFASKNLFENYQKMV